MKKSNYLSAYPIFIMAEQLKFNGCFEDTPLDEMWEISCSNYETFIDSEFNDENQSEYDCIVAYVKNLTN